MRFRCLILVLSFGLLANSQSNIPDYMELVNTFDAAAKSRNFRDMKRSSEKLIKYYRDDYAGYGLNAFFLMCRSQNNRAESQVQMMLQLNPVNAGAYSVAAYLEYLFGRAPEAELYLQYAFQLNTDPNFKTIIFEDIDTIKEMAFRDDLENLKAIVNKVEAQDHINIDRATEFVTALGELYQGRKQ